MAHTEKQGACIALPVAPFYVQAMPTLVLRIPDHLAADIEAEARRLKLTKSDVARRRLAAASDRTPSTGFDLIADLVGVEKEGPSDMSARKKDYLKETGFGREKLGC